MVNQIPTAEQHKSKVEKYTMDYQRWSELPSFNNINKMNIQLFTLFIALVTKAGIKFVRKAHTDQN